jgi:hypothetical protein
MTLPDALQEELYQFLRRNTHEEAQVWLQKKHGVETSTGALSKFWHWYPDSAWLKHSADFADQLKDQVAKLPQLAGKAQEISAIAQAAFEIQAAQDRNPCLHLALVKRRQKDAELALKRENQALRLRQYEEKISLVRQSLEQAKSKGGLSAETRELIEAQLKLL